MTYFNVFIFHKQVDKVAEVYIFVFF